MNTLDPGHREVWHGPMPEEHKPLPPESAGTAERPPIAHWISVVPAVLCRSLRQPSLLARLWAGDDQRGTALLGGAGD